MLKVMRRPFPAYAVLALSAILSVIAFPGSALAQTAASAELAKANEAIPQSARMQPAELETLIRSDKAPTILQVGFDTLYKQGHIEGAVFAGPAGREEGRKLLRRKAEHLDRGKLLVIYCGCCPWPHCPNIHPAYEMLRKMGFTDLKVLYIPHNFGTDWVMLGYPTARPD